MGRVQGDEAVKINFESSKGKNPDSRSGLRIPYAPAKRVFPKWRWYLVVLIVCSPLVYILLRICGSLFVSTSSGIIALEKINITSPQITTIESVLSTSGALVKKGQVLFILKFDSQIEKLDLLKAEREALKQYSEVPVNTRELKQRIELAKRERDYYTQRLSDMKDLFDKGAATKVELDSAESNYISASKNLLRAQEELNRATRTERPEYKIRLRQIDAELALISERQTEIVSPYDGIIVNVFVSPTQTVYQGAVMATLACSEPVSMVAYVAPKDIRSISTKKPVSVKFPGGEIIKAQVKNYPNMTQPLPQELSQPISASRFAALRVELEPLEPIPNSLAIDGMPFSVYWGFNFKFWD